MLLHKHIRREAEISPCGKFRWSLRRSWRPGYGERGLGVVCFVMLNPSTADGEIDDPTIQRCLGFAQRWGFTTLSVRNLFPFRATDPRDLRLAGYPTGDEQGNVALAVAGTAHLTIAAWGANAPKSREEEALKLFRGAPIYCLGQTVCLRPRHPLYVKQTTDPRPFRNTTADWRETVEQRLAQY